MLKQRVLTAVALLLVLLPALFSTHMAYWWGVSLLLMAAGAWEWGRLNACGPLTSLLLAFVCLLACVVVWDASWMYAWLTHLWWGLSALWLVGGIFMLQRGPSYWRECPRWIRLPLGLLVLWGAWVAVAQARAVGINFLLSAMASVWVADIAAYFAGRAWGGRLVARKLAVSISPGKTWEGALGGALGVVVLSLLWCWLDRQLAVDSLSLYSRLPSPWVMVLCAVALSAMSVVGDLMESLVKRSAGMKDSSGLLPGHGGVLDRLDALLPTMPMAMMLYAWWP